MPGDGVRIQIPATGGHVIIARLAAANLAQRMGFSIGRQDDAKIAIDEACSLLLDSAEPGSDLTVDLEPSDGGIDVRITATTGHGHAPRPSSFGWTVLSAVADMVHTKATRERNIVLSFTLGAARPRSV